MSMVMTPSSINRAPRPSSLADVLDLILDKGLVIDAYVRVSVIGIEILVVDARIVVASVDTYLRFAEAVNRLDLSQTKEATTYKELVEGGSKKATEGGTEGVIEGVEDEFSKHKGNGRSKDKDEPSTGKASGEQEQNRQRSRQIRAQDERGQEDDGDEEDGGRSGNGNGRSKGDKGFMGRLAERARFS